MVRFALVVGASAALAAALLGCGAAAPGASPTALATAATPPATTVPSSTPFVRPTIPASTPEFPTPAALQGAWHQVVTSGEAFLLTFGIESYTIEIGPETRGGKVVVHGDQITFSGADQCDGSGTYRWAIDATGTLTLTPLDADPCGRKLALVGNSYRR